MQTPPCRARRAVLRPAATREQPLPAAAPSAPARRRRCSGSRRRRRRRRRRPRCHARPDVRVPRAIGAAIRVAPRPHGRIAQAQLRVVRLALLATSGPAYPPAPLAPMAPASSPAPTAPAAPAPASAPASASARRPPPAQSRLRTRCPPRTPPPLPAPPPAPAACVRHLVVDVPAGRPLDAHRRLGSRRHLPRVHQLLAAAQLRRRAARRVVAHLVSAGRPSRRDLPAAPHSPCAAGRPRRGRRASAARRSAARRPCAPPASRRRRHARRGSHAPTSTAARGRQSAAAQAAAPPPRPHARLARARELAHARPRRA